MTKNNIKFALLFWLVVDGFLALVIGFAMWDHYGASFWPVISITILIVDIVIMIALLCYVGFTRLRFRRANAIYKERGICDDYITAFTAAAKKPTNFQLISLANAYTCLERFAEAEQVLGSMPGELLLHGRDKAWYYKSYICLYLNTGRYKQACDIFDASRDYLEKFFEGEGPVGASYFDDAALCLALRRDFAGADHYRALAQSAVVSSPERGYMPLMIMAEIFILDGNETEAMRAVDAAGSLIYSCSTYKYGWQRDECIRGLNNGVSLARRIRAQLYS